MFSAALKHVNRYSPKLYSTSAFKLNNSPCWSLISDIHFQEKGLDRLNATLDWFIADITKNNIERIFILGDTLNTRSSVSLISLNAAGNFFNRLFELSSLQHIHVLIGNHDMFLKHSTAITSLDLLNIKPLNKQLTLHKNIELLNIDNQQVLFIPYHEDQTKIIQQIQLLEKEGNSWNNTVAFGHLAITGAHTNGFSDHSNRKYTGGLAVETLNQFKKTFSGHFHIHHTLFNGDSQQQKGSITYVGSPVQWNYSDVDDIDRGFIYYYPHTNSFKLMRSPFADTFKSVDINQVDKLDLSTVANKYIMVRENSHSSLEDYNKAKTKLLRAGAADVRKSKSNLLKPAQSILASAISSDPAKPEAAGALLVNSADNSLVPAVDIHSIEGESERNISEDLAAYLSTLVLPVEKRADLFKLGISLINSIDSTLDNSIVAAKIFFAELKTLRIENFLGVEGCITLHFDRFPDGVWFVEGLNGAGKSTLMEAIVWVQFGRFLRSDMLADYAVNDSVGANCSVKLDFTNGYSIERYRKYSKLGGNGVRIYKNGELLENFERGESSSTQIALESLLNINFDSFARTIVLGSDSTHNFLSSTQQQRREIIEKLLGLEKFDNYSEITRLQRKRISQKITELRAKLMAMQQKAQESEHRVQEISNSRSFAQLALGNLQKELSGQQQQFSALNHSVQAAKEEREKRLSGLRSEHQIAVQQGVLAKHANYIQTQRHKLNLRLNQLNSQLNHSHLHIEKLQLQAQTLSKTAAKNELQQELSNLMQLQQQTETSLQQLQHTVQHAASSCPACLQDIYNHSTAQENVAQYQTQQNMLIAHEIQQLQAALQPLQHVLAKQSLSKADRPENSQQSLSSEDIFTDIEAIKGNQQRWENELQTVQADFNRAVSSYCDKAGISVEQLEKLGNSINSSAYADSINNLSSISTELARLSSAVEPSEALDRLVRLIQLGNNKIAAKQSELLVLQANLTREQQNQAGDIQQLEEINKDLAVQMSSDELYEFWENGFSKKANSMRAYMLQSSITHLNSLINYVLNVFSDEGSMIHPLAAELDSQLRLVESVGAEAAGISYAKRSGGQRRRTDLAIFFSLMELSRLRSLYRCDYMFLDEIFDTLDENGQEAVQRWISTLHDKHKIKKIFVISHSSTLNRVGYKLNAQWTSQGTEYSVNSMFQHQFDVSQLVSRELASSCNVGKKEKNSSLPGSAKQPPSSNKAKSSRSRKVALNAQ
jgi:DNA repair exonuclease SbcCD ATPase subunit